MTKRNYKLSENLEFRTSEQDETGIYFKGEFMRPIGGAEGSLIDQVLDLERRLAETNALLDDIHQYVDEHDLAKLGESKVQALLDDNYKKSRFIMQHIKRGHS